MGRVAKLLWWKSWLWCVGVLVGRDFWDLSIQAPAQSRIMNNTHLPAVALSTESWKPLRTKIINSLSMTPNHLADVFSNIQSEPPKPLLVVVASCFVVGQ